MAKIVPIPASNEYLDLGAFGRPITTTNHDAQVWFNRGLTWSYAFNHVESARCFEQAVAHDPSCAMAYWGLAYAVGPNYNKPWEAFDPNDLRACVKRGHEAARKARENAANATPLERALVTAIQSRFPSDQPLANPEAVNRAYAAAMEPVYQEFGDDLDVATLYADALMNITPWGLWNLFTGKPAAKAPTVKVGAVMDRALAHEKASQHPGLLHMYIHYIEMSPTPELGINAADQLRTLAPDAGHLQHMPTHLDILIGDWRRSIASNYRSTVADDKYVRHAGPFNFYTFYRLHDYHSLIYAGMFAGKFKTAMDAVERMEASVPEAVLRMQSPPMANWMEYFMSVRMHVMVRFGRWEDLKKMALPKDQELYSNTTAITHYARGLAFAATGDLSSAEHEQKLFHEAWQRVPESRRAYNSTCRETLAVASAMLAGEIAYRRADYDHAFAKFRDSITLEDNLPYSEPWSWMQPTRHAYAALLLEQGHIEDAAAVYRADLGLDKTLIRPRRHPNNVWSLTGYYECLVRLGRTDEAEVIEPAARVARAAADVDVRASCFCRLDTSEVPRMEGGAKCCL